MTYDQKARVEELWSEGRSIAFIAADLQVDPLDILNFINLEAYARRLAEQTFTLWRSA